jgi:uncharacterized protein YutE (UPF0331/DUF86 family)
MFDIERIKQLMIEIEGYFNDLEEMSITPDSVLKSKEKYHAGSMVLLSMINKVIDLGDEIVAGKQLGTPEKYRDIFIILEEKKIVDRNVSKNLQLLVKYRNLLAHEYGTIAPTDVSMLLKKLSVVKEFEKIVKKLI